MPCSTHTTQYDIKAIFGQRLKAWRKTRRLPLKKLAQELGTSISGISQWERGLVFPTAENLALLSAYTRLPPCHFLCPGQCQDTSQEIEAKLKSSRSLVRLAVGYIDIN